MEDATQSGPAPCFLCSLCGVLIARGHGPIKDKVIVRCASAKRPAVYVCNYGIKYVS